MKRKAAEERRKEIWDNKGTDAFDLLHEEKPFRAPDSDEEENEARAK